jgi:6-phosphogluconolactonase
MVAEDNIKSGAEAYEALINKQTPDGILDMIMLGMGDDGHTASLFPETQALKVTDRWVVANEVPQQQTTRMTFTFPLINQAKLCAMYVLGENKSKILRRVIRGDEDFPASKVGTAENPSLWIIDDAAGAQILKA